MSQLSKSLEKRIQELTDSIEAQKTELAAYHHVLHLELSKGGTPVEIESAESEAAPATVANHHASAHNEQEAGTSALPSLAEIDYKGNKTSLVADIVKTHGGTGATPKDVDAFFTAKNIKRSKNLIYNTLSYLVAQKKLVRREGKYYPVGGSSASPKKTASAPTATPSKRRLSPEGLKRIKEALKKRWADKRAAEGVAARPSKKKAAKKK